MSTTAIRRQIWVILSLLLPTPGIAQTDSGTDGLWRDVDPTVPTQRQLRGGGAIFHLMPKEYRLLRLDSARMTEKLGLAQARGAPQTISIEVPLPDGRNVVLDVYKSSVMAPALAAKYPDIRTYTARGRTERAIHGRLDFTRHGFHGLLDTPEGQVFVDPRGTRSDRYYVSYYRRDYAPDEKSRQPLNCEVHDSHVGREFRASASSPVLAQASGDELRTYELAVAATAEYTDFHDFGSPVPDALAAIVTTINRVNQVMIRDLSIQLELVADNDQIIYTDPGSDPYDNEDPVAMLSQNQDNLDTVIGSANYDVGHVFGTGDSGIAALESVCDNALKANGVTGASFPIGDPFDIDFVAHEIGHQLGGNHTFNATTSSCGGGNRNGPTAVEPGSGSTILAYAGICGSNNLQFFSDPMYSTISIEEIVDYTVNGGGDSCAAVNVTGNTPPTVTVTPSYTIPADTPFELTGSAGDPDSGDMLTYSWEQIDAGSASDADVVLSDNAIFRAFPPVAAPTRVFPRPQDVLYGTTTLGEILPDISRDVNFRLTARDQNGGVDSDEMLVEVENTGQAFSVTSFNTAVNIPKNSTVNITWNVADTDIAPIGCAGVDISMSTDGGITFPVDLMTSIPNDGSANVLTPDMNAIDVRIKAKCTDNVFFDINDADLTLGAANAPALYEDVPGSPIGFDSGTTNFCSTPLTRTINVPENRIIDDLDVGISLDHAWRGDVSVLVRSPTNTEAVIIVEDSTGYESYLNYDVRVDDEVPFPLNDGSDDDTGSPIYNRRAAPDNPLSVFEGEDANGIWEIEICDNYSEDGGAYRRSGIFVLETDNDDDGAPDSVDTDDDDDGMSDTFENNNGLDPFDAGDADDDPDGDGQDNLAEFGDDSDPNHPDTDGDGIGDGFDLDVLGPSNLCDAAESVLAGQDVLDTQILQCAAPVSITVQASVNIETGGRLELISPEISLQPGFSVPAGGELGISSGDPVPGAVPP